MIPKPHLASPETRILGIDPGLNISGYGLITFANNQPCLIEAGVVRSTRSHSLERRIRSIYEGITEVIQTTSPDIVAVEQLFTHYDRPSTAILMGHARGVLLLAAANAGLEVTSWRPTQVKKVLTGNGRAPKAQVQLSAARLLNLPDIPDPPDVADALAIAMCHCYLNRNRMKTT